MESGHPGDCSRGQIATVPSQQQPRFMFPTVKTLEYWDSDEKKWVVLISPPKYEARYAAKLDSSGLAIRVEQGPFEHPEFEDKQSTAFRYLMQPGERNGKHNALYQHISWSIQDINGYQIYDDEGHVLNIDTLEFEYASFKVEMGGRLDGGRGLEGGDQTLVKLRNHLVENLEEEESMWVRFSCHSSFDQQWTHVLDAYGLRRISKAEANMGSDHAFGQVNFVGVGRVVQASDELVDCPIAMNPAVFAEDTMRFELEYWSPEEQTWILPPDLQSTDFRLTARAGFLMIYVSAFANEDQLPRTPHVGGPEALRRIKKVRDAAMGSRTWILWWNNETDILGYGLDENHQPSSPYCRPVLAVQLRFPGGLSHMGSDIVTHSQVATLEKSVVTLEQAFVVLKDELSTCMDKTANTWVRFRATKPVRKDVAFLTELDQIEFFGLGTGDMPLRFKKSTKKAKDTPGKIASIRPVKLPAAKKGSPATNLARWRPENLATQATVAPQKSSVTSPKQALAEQPQAQAPSAQVNYVVTKPAPNMINRPAVAPVAGVHLPGMSTPLVKPQAQVDAQTVSELAKVSSEDDADQEPAEQNWQYRERMQKEIGEIKRKQLALHLLKEQIRLDSKGVEGRSENNLSTATAARLRQSTSGIASQSSFVVCPSVTAQHIVKQPAKSTSPTDNKAAPEAAVLKQVTRPGWQPPHLRVTETNHFEQAICKKHSELELKPVSKPDVQPKADIQVFDFQRSKPAPETIVECAKGQFKQMLKKKLIKQEAEPVVDVLVEVGLSTMAEPKCISQITIKQEPEFDDELLFEGEPKTRSERQPELEFKEDLLDFNAPVSYSHVSRLATENPMVSRKASAFPVSQLKTELVSNVATTSLHGSPASFSEPLSTLSSNLAEINPIGKTKQISYGAVKASRSPLRTYNLQTRSQSPAFNSSGPFISNSHNYGAVVRPTPKLQGYFNEDRIYISPFRHVRSKKPASSSSLANAYTAINKPDDAEPGKSIQLGQPSGLEMIDARDNIAAFRYPVCRIDPNSSNHTDILSPASLPRSPLDNGNQLSKEVERSISRASVISPQCSPFYGISISSRHNTGIYDELGGHPTPYSQRSITLAPGQVYSRGHLVNFDANEIDREMKFRMLQSRNEERKLAAESAILQHKMGLLEEKRLIEQQLRDMGEEP